MPAYQFQCNTCGHITEKTIPRQEAGSAWCWCMRCGRYAFRIQSEPEKPKATSFLEDIHQHADDMKSIAGFLERTIKKANNQEE